MYTIEFNYTHDYSSYIGTYISKEVFKDILDHFVYEEKEDDFYIEFEHEEELNIDIEYDLSDDEIQEIIKENGIDVSLLLNERELTPYEIIELKNKLSSIGLENIKKLMED